MDKDSIQVFIESLTHFYKQIDAGDIQLEVPYLLDSSLPVVSDFTGIIGISGKQRGCVYYTCPQVMLSYILTSMGETSINQENLCDMVGEIANTIAGNARRKFGNSFMISVPIVVQGTPEKIHLPENCRCMVIPTKWRQYKSYIVVGLT